MFKGSTASEDLSQVVRALRSVAEPTRLRLLALLSHGEYTVGELGEVLGQSQPRISRHLKLLTEAGFLDRFREEQCVYYRVPVAGQCLAWSRQILSMLEPDGAVLRQDRSRAAEVVRRRAAVAVRALNSALSAGEAESLAGTAEDEPQAELARILLEELGPASVGELLDIGTGSGSMLQVLAPLAEHAVGIDISTPALRVARARIHGAGLTHCEFRRGDMYRLPVESASFDLAALDRVLTLTQDPVAVLCEAARTLRAGARLLAVEDFDQLELHQPANPLIQLRRWLQAAGLEVIRLRPCDITGRHLIIALARSALQPVIQEPTAPVQIPPQSLPQRGVARL